MINKMLWKTLKFLSMISFVFILFTLFYYVLDAAPGEESMEDIVPTTATRENDTQLLEKFTSAVYPDNFPDNFRCEVSG